MPMLPTFIKQLVIWKIVLATIFLGFARPSFSALPAPANAQYWNMNRSVGGVAEQAMRSRGFAQNDPRYYATVQGMSAVSTAALSSAAGAVAGAAVVTLVGVTAPAWASIALFAAVSTVVGFGVSLAVGSTIEWVFGDPQSATPVTVTGSAAATPALVQGGPYYQWGNNLLIGPTGESVLRSAIAAYYGPTASKQYRCINYQSSGNNYTCLLQYRNLVGGQWSDWYSSTTQTAYYAATGSPYSCPSGQVYKAGCVAATLPTTDGPQTLSQAAQSLTQEQLDQPLNPAVVAAVTNSLWKQAASQPGYSGFPYPMSSPVTASEAQAWQQANPQSWPTVQDFVQPRPEYQTNPNVAALPSPAAQPGTVPSSFANQPNPSTVNPAQQSSLINLGPDPGIGSPGLETIPTAQQILDPILNMLPAHKNFSASSQVGQCPTPTISLYGTHVLDAHCTLIDQNKSIIQAAMTFAWTALALFIVLSA
jgi:hypothetical protein